jgi:GntR family transcriptional regulator
MRAPALRKSLPATPLAIASRGKRPIAKEGDVVPRYKQILDILRERVASGFYPLNANLPNESELCAEFEASRYTVREALRMLVQQGMVKRRQRAGSVVVAREPQDLYAQSFSSLAELFQFALDTHYVLISTRRVKIDADIAARIGGVAGSTWLLVKGMRWTKPGGDPICYTHSYIPLRLDWIVPELPNCVGAFYAHLERRAKEPITEAVQEIRGEAITEETASYLMEPTGSISLCVCCRYVSVKGTLIASLNWHSARNFVYRMQLQRNS